MGDYAYIDLCPVCNETTMHRQTAGPLGSIWKCDLRDCPGWIYIPTTDPNVLACRTAVEPYLRHR